MDNGSTDGSGGRLDEEYNDVDVVYTEENLGFPGGMNAGIRAAEAYDPEYLWLLSNDVVIIDENILTELVSRLELDPQVGAISPVIETMGGDTWFYCGRIDWNSGRAYHADNCVSNGDELVINDYIPICSTLYPAKIFDTVGYLDEDYFLYGSDVDLGVRLSEAGYKLVTDTRLITRHVGTASTSGELGPTFSYYTTRNYLIFMNRYRKRLEAWKFWTFLNWFGRKLAKRIISLEFYGAIAMFQGAIAGFRGRIGRGPYP